MQKWRQPLKNVNISQIRKIVFQHKIDSKMHAGCEVRLRHIVEKGLWDHVRVQEPSSQAVPNFVYESEPSDISTSRMLREARQLRPLRRSSDSKTRHSCSSFDLQSIDPYEVGHGEDELNRAWARVPRLTFISLRKMEVCEVLKENNCTTYSVKQKLKVGKRK